MQALLIANTYQTTTRCKNAEKFTKQRLICVRADIDVGISTSSSSLHISGTIFARASYARLRDARVAPFMVIVNLRGAAISAGLDGNPRTYQWWTARTYRAKNCSCGFVEKCTTLVEKNRRWWVCALHLPCHKSQWARNEQTIFCCNIRGWFSATAAYSDAFNVKLPINIFDIHSSMHPSINLSTGWHGWVLRTIALKGLASHAGKLLTLAVTHMQINGHRPEFTQCSTTH